MNAKVAIIHTTAVTIAPLNALVKKEIAGCSVVNILDDSILPELVANGGRTEDVAERLVTYAQFAARQQVDAVLFACSSVGGIAERAACAVSVPVLRIDEAMIDRAVSGFNDIGVAATLPTTLTPTLGLIERKAAERHKSVKVTTMLASEAYRRLVEGDKAGHDAILKRELSALAENVEVVVLAQASMAGVVEQFDSATASKFLASPELGIGHLKEVLMGSKS